jgi:chromosome segregation ATPase
VGAYYGPSAADVYRAESALRASEAKLAEIRKQAEKDEGNYAKAKTRWSGLADALKRRKEAYSTANKTLMDAKKAMDDAIAVHENAVRENNRLSVELAEAEKESAEAEVDLSRSRSLLGRHDEAMQTAKEEVNRLTKIAEEKIKLLGKLPF